MIACLFFAASFYFGIVYESVAGGSKAEFSMYNTILLNKWTMVFVLAFGMGVIGLVS